MRFAIEEFRLNIEDKVASRDRKCASRLLGKKEWKLCELSKLNCVKIPGLGQSSSRPSNKDQLHFAPVD